MVWFDGDRGALRPRPFALIDQSGQWMTIDSPRFADPFDPDGSSDRSRPSSQTYSTPTMTPPPGHPACQSLSADTARSCEADVPHGHPIGPLTPSNTERWSRRGEGITFTTPFQAPRASAPPVAGTCRRCWRFGTQGSSRRTCCCRMRPGCLVREAREAVRAHAASPCHFGRDSLGKSGAGACPPPGNNARHALSAAVKLGLF